MIKTLIVEDEAFVALDLQDILQRLGHDVIGIAVSGEDAVKSVTQNPPDLILMDVSLAGELSGIEAVLQIRQTYEMPIIYITAYSDDATIGPMKKTEPFEYLLKPFNEQVLRVTIEFALHKAAVRKEQITSERLLATTLRSIGDAVITTDQQGHVLFLNPVAEELTGWTMTEATGLHLDSVFHIVNEQTRQPAFDPVKAVLETGKNSHLANNTLLISRDGTEYPIEDSAAPIMDDNDTIFGVVLVFRDVTKRQQSELWLRQAQKLDSLGLLAGGIAHDFNNILGTISINTSMLREKGTQSPQNMRIIERIQRASEQAAELTAQLLSYAGGQPLNIEVLELNEIIDSTLDLVSPSQPDEVEVVRAFCNEPLPILAERSQIQQVILNLIINSFDAMKESDNGGTLALNTTRRFVSQTEFDAYLSKSTLVEGDYAELTISDTGAGIDKATLAQIFDPFFSTKPTGSGLGLAATLGIVYQCNGGLSVQSQVDIGTSFTILLPCQTDGMTLRNEDHQSSNREEGSDASGNTNVHADQEERRMTILLADDQADILDTLNDVLIAEGYQTLLASDGTEALKLFEAHIEQIALVVLDIRMPTMNGTDALLSMHKHNPNLRAILMTGHADVTTLQSYHEFLTDVPILQKPFSFNQVIQLVRTELETQ